ncbi:MAG: DASS family sodium-coupled anion symporter [Acidobacteria bacterium]|nr:DASS family sodium-coupled anion symporter [Acidobacteriota bacterium]
MQTFHGAAEAAATYSPAEEQFNRRRRTVGTWLAPIVFFSVWFAPFGLPPDAHTMAAIMAVVIVLWLTEALPIAVTAMFGPVLAVVLGVAPAREALAPFADPVIFLFIGSFILAQAMFVHGVDRRIAYTALSSPLVGTRPFRILLVYAGVTTALSMWISNTATTAMMFPIGLSIVAHLTRGGTAQYGQVRRFAMALMLITSFGASVGGMGTPVGTPPNLIGIGMLEKIVGVRVTFFSWMAIGVPLVILLFGYLLLQFYFSSVRGLPVAQGSTDMVREEMRKLGPVTRAQWNVIAAFLVTVTLWVLPGLLALAGAGDSVFARRYAAVMPEGIAAMVGALLLFFLPVHWRSRRFTLSWDEAVQIDWGIVLLYGGGLAVGELAFKTGLASAIGEGVTTWLPSQSPLALTMLFTFAAIVVSEAASNTASANMIIPIAIAVSQAAGVRPIEPVLGATLGASMGFMMPISTPPNAIIYSSGYVPIGQMMRHGFLLDVVAFVLIVVLVMLLGPLLF